MDVDCAVQMGEGRSLQDDLKGGHEHQIHCLILDYRGKITEIVPLSEYLQTAM